MRRVVNEDGGTGKRAAVKNIVVEQALQGN
jgi:hypothetical protein